MRFPRWTAAAVLLLPAAYVRAETGDDPDPAQAAIDALRTGDATRRRDAATRIADLGYDAVERAARQSAPLDDAAWKAFADAVRGARWEAPLACALLAGAHEVPEASRGRVTDLAKDLVPASVTPRTREELRANAHRILVEERDLCDREFWPWPVAMRGREAYPVVMEFVRDADALGADASRTHGLLALVAQREDVPDLRRLLVAGNTIVAGALARLQSHGVSEAADALVAGVEAGRFDQRLSSALAGTSIDSTLVRSVRGWSSTALAGREPRRRAAAALRTWATARGREISDGESALAATVFAAFDSREDVPRIESWAGECRGAEPLVTLAKALVRLGSRKGVEILVRVVAAPTREREDATAEPASPDPGTSVPPPTAPGDRLHDPLAEGVPSWLQTQSSTWLGDVEFESRSPVDARPPGTRWVRVGHADGPWTHPHGEAWKRAVPEIAAWWKRVHDLLWFDEVSGRWRLRAA